MKGREVAAQTIVVSSPWASGLLPRLNQFREFMKWAGTAMFAVGAVVISVSPEISMNAWPFATFGIGHALWALAGLLMRDKAVIVLNIMYLPLDVYAIVLRF